MWAASNQSAFIEIYKDPKKTKNEMRKALKCGPTSSMDMCGWAHTFLMGHAFIFILLFKLCRLASTLYHSTFTARWGAWTSFGHFYPTAPSNWPLLPCFSGMPFSYLHHIFAPAVNTGVAEDSYFSIPHVTLLFSIQ